MKQNQRRAGSLGIGEIEQFDGRAVFVYEGDADAIKWLFGGIRISRPASPESKDPFPDCAEVAAWRSSHDAVKVVGTPLCVRV
jgi:hypothetical protein